MAAALVGAGLILLGGCFRGDSPNREIHVLAATSLADEIRILADEFGRQSGLRIVVVSGASNSLARQILSGAPADVFVSAHQQWHLAVAASGSEAGLAVDVAGNRLCLVTAAGNPLGIEDVRGLLDTKVEKIAIGGRNVPVGEYARQYLDAMGMLESIGKSQKVIHGSSAATVAMWLERGEVDAAFVYGSDVTAGLHVVTEVPASMHDRIIYAASVVSRQEQPEGAAEFVDFLVSRRAKKLFRSAGLSVDLPVAGSTGGN